jgi:hypothetical protein
MAFAIPNAASLPRTDPPPIPSELNLKPRAVPLPSPVAPGADRLDLQGDSLLHTPIVKWSSVRSMRTLTSPPNTRELPLQAFDGTDRLS